MIYLDKDNIYILKTNPEDGVKIVFTNQLTKEDTEGAITLGGSLYTVKKIEGLSGQFDWTIYSAEGNVLQTGMASSLSGSNRKDYTTDIQIKTYQQ